MSILRSPSWVAIMDKARTFAFQGNIVTEIPGLVTGSQSLETLLAAIRRTNSRNVLYLLILFPFS